MSDPSMSQDSAGMRPVPGFGGYFVDQFGNVYSSLVLKGNSTNRRVIVDPLRRRKLRPAADKDGYLQVRIKSDAGKLATKKVHHLVLVAFVGPKPDGYECLHDDGVPSNNCADNLRWGTPAENTEDKARHGKPQGYYDKRLRRAKSSKLHEEDVRWIRFCADKVPLRRLSSWFGVSEACIGDIRNGRVWKDVTVGDLPGGYT